MSELPIISTPISEAWPLWFMFIFLYCAVWVEKTQRGMMLSCFRAVFSKGERMYGDSASSILGIIMLDIFRIGVLAMGLYVLCHNRVPFSIVTFGIIVLVVIGVMVMKLAVSQLISYVFDLKHETEVYIPQYNRIWTFFCILLYPLVLLYIHTGTNIIMLCVAVAAMLLMLGITVVKLVQHYMVQSSTLIYILIYFLTVEVLPLVGTIYGITKFA